MKRILLDVDGVIVDTIPEWLGMYNAEFSDCLSVDQITEWNIEKFVKPECGKNIYKYLYNPNLYDNVKMVQGARWGFEVLIANGYDVVFVSSGFQPAKYKWMHVNGFLKSENWQFDPKLVVAHDKSVIKGDIMIDDGIHNLDSFCGVRICFDQPWNRDVKDISKYDYKVYGWNDVVRLLMEAKKGGFGEEANNVADGVFFTPI